MKCEGVVKEKSDNVVTVEVVRRGACGGDCSSCGGCGNSVMKVAAKNSVNAKIGDTVLLESSTKRVLLSAFLVYIMPILLFFTVYILLEESKAIYAAGCEIAVLALYIFCIKKAGLSLKAEINAVEIIDKNRSL